MKFIKKLFLSFCLFLKKTLQLLNDPKIARINKLLSILVFPFLGFLFFVSQPLFNSEQYKIASVLFALVILQISFLCLFNPNSLGLLTSLLRSGLTYQFVQFLFSVCIKIELFINAPYVALRLLWLCFIAVYTFLLFESMDKSYVYFLTLHKALLMIGFIYIRLRVSFFNADALSIAINQTVTFEESISFLEKSLILDNSAQPKFISLSSPLCSKLSSRTNHLVLPFLIQTRGMSSKAAAGATRKALTEVLVQNPGVFVKVALASITSVVTGTVWIANDRNTNDLK